MDKLFLVVTVTCLLGAAVWGAKGLIAGDRVRVAPVGISIAGEPQPLAGEAVPLAIKPQ